MTLEQALDHFHSDAVAKFDALNRIVLPLVGQVRVINRLTKLVPGSRVRHQLGGSGRIQMISRGMAFVDWDNGKTNSIDLVDLAAEDDL